MTNADIVRLSGRIFSDFSEAEILNLSAHIQKQIESFAMLDNVNTDNTEPTFDLQGEGRFMVERSGE